MRSFDYEALQISSQYWHESDDAPFVKYYLGVLLKAYREFEERVEHLRYRALSKPERIRCVVEREVGKITKKEIMEKCRDISKITVERTLAELVKSGYLLKIGSGRTTAYVKPE